MDTSDPRSRSDTAELFMGSWKGDTLTCFSPMRIRKLEAHQGIKLLIRGREAVVIAEQGQLNDIATCEINGPQAENEIIIMESG